MTKHKAKEQKSVADMMPDELNAVKALVNEFMSKIASIDNEIELLKDDRKEVIEDYGEKLDMPTLQLALKALKIEASVQHRDAYDLFLEALSLPKTDK